MKTLRDAVYGVAIGDALGSPVQFKIRDTFSPVNEMLYCESFHKKPGTWTDDTSLTLALCDSIRKKNEINIKDIRKRFNKWLNSLMRIIPLAFVENITDQEIAEVSAITHAHNIACEACKIYIHIARDLINDKSISEAVKQNSPKSYSIFTSLNSLETRQREEIKSTGYVVDTLEAALWSLLKTNTFRDAVETAVNLGGDADTIGAVTGGLAGIIYGIEGIPKEWIEALRKKKIIEKYLFS